MKSLATLLLISTVLLVGWVAVRRPRWRAVWPMLLTPAPWALLFALIALGRGYAKPIEGWSPGIHPIRWTPLVMLAATAALSVWAVGRAKGVEWPAVGLALVNAVISLVIAAGAYIAIEAVVL